jgi:uncharacterized membrane protein YdjX (TVP38/TMEM64 family)
MEPNSKKNISILLAVVFIGFLVWSSIAFQDFFQKIVPFFENVAREDKFLSVLVFIVLGMISTMLSSFSSAPLVPIAIIVWGSALTALYLCVGWIIGDILSYFIGYWAGNPIIRKLLPYEKIRFYLKKIPPDAEFTMILLFILSMPSEIPGYTIGALRYKFTKYLIATTLNEIFYSALVVYAASALIAKNPLIFFGSFIFGILLFGYMFYLFQKKLRV